MNATLLKIFKEETMRLFDFLSSDYAFADPQMTVDEQTSFVTITYKGRNLAIQLILDARAEDIDCKVARVDNGKVTKHYGRDEGGNLVRESLFAMLTRKGVKGSLFTKVSGMSFEKRIPITLEDYARMLKQNSKDILSDSSSVFD